MKTLLRSVFGILFLLATGTIPMMGQDNAPNLHIEVEPEAPSLRVGEQLRVTARVVDSLGSIQPDSVIFFSSNSRQLSVTRQGLMKAHQPGDVQIVILKPAQGDNGRMVKRIDVKIPYPELDKITISGLPDRIYQGTSVDLKFSVLDETGYEREDLEVTNVSSSNTEVASLTPTNRLRARSTGTITITARKNGLTGSWQAEVIENPVAAVELTADRQTARTGDVIHFNAVAKKDDGTTVEDAPITYTFNATYDDNLGRGAAGVIKGDGRFVANQAGLYTILAKNASHADEVTVKIEPRNVGRELTVLGHGKVTDVRTSDLWVWEGIDGRDYAATGTWGAKGEAYFWDVTDRSNPTIIDTVTVDARTVNDVKVSDDGRIAVISREGASNRKNGFVILDISDPHNVAILSRFNDGLTGGVHNVFIYKDHVFAVNNGRRYDIINIEDPRNPYRVSRFELDTPGHSVHDVWVKDGIAYSSNWDDGVVAVDVGSNLDDLQGAGGSLQNPKKLGSYTYPSGWNHAAFPFQSRSTGDFYVVAGDEAFPGGTPAGWIHFFKLNNWDNSEEVARYEVPEAGTHNFWIKNDTLYVAYYQGGLRVVDISGELLGDLYEQGREIARFLPKDSEGFTANEPMTWGPQPYKGDIFISDFNSGLWILELKEEADPQGSN